MRARFGTSEGSAQRVRWQQRYFSAIEATPGRLGRGQRFSWGTNVLQTEGDPRRPGRQGVGAGLCPLHVSITAEPVLEADQAPAVPELQIEGRTANFLI